MMSGSRGSGNKPSHMEHALKIMADNHFLTLRDTGEILHYENGTFREGGEIIIKEKVERLVENCTINARREIIKSIRNRTYVDKSAFDTDPFLLNVKNGVLDLATMKLMDHTPSLPFRSQVDAAHDRNAKADRYREFIGEVLESERERTLIHELFASALLRSHLNLEKAAILVGPSSSGKTTLLRAMMAVFGEDNISAVSIHDMIYQRFARSSLDGKMLNIYADTSSQKLDRIGIIKSMISGVPIEVEKKNKPSYTIEPYAVMVFAANRLPEVNEDTDAIYRCFMIINFRRQFTGKDRDPMLLASLTTEEEKSGILNILLEHAKPLLKNKKLTDDPTMAEIRAEWHDKAGPITQFINTFILKAKGSSEDKSIIYSLYAGFCEKSHFVPLSQRGFTESFRTKGFVDKMVRKDGKTVRGWLDIKLKEGSMEQAGGTTTDGDAAGPITQFINTFILKAKGSSEDKSIIYSLYAGFCEKSHFVPLSQRGFTESFRTKGFVDKMVRKDGKTVRGWLDIKLKEGSMEQAGGTTTDGDAAGPITQFINTFILKAKGSSEDKSIIYSLYAGFCEKSHFVPLSQRGFTESFRTKGFVDKMVRKDGKTVRGWLDIKLKEGSMEQAGGTTTDGDAAGPITQFINTFILKAKGSSEDKSIIYSLYAGFCEKSHFVPLSQRGFTESFRTKGFVDKMVRKDGKTVRGWLDIKLKEGSMEQAGGTTTDGDAAGPITQFINTFILKAKGSSEDKSIIYSLYAGFCEKSHFVPLSQRGFTESFRTKGFVDKMVRKDGKTVRGWLDIKLKEGSMEQAGGTTTDGDAAGPITQFINTFILKAKGSSEDKSIIYSLYAGFCEKSHFVPLSQRGFTESFRTKGFVDKMVRKDGKTVRGWLDIKLKEGSMEQAGGTTTDGDAAGPITQFINTFILKAKGSSEDKSIIYSLYAGFCEKSHFVPLSQRGFTESFRTKGFVDKMVRKDGKTVRGWLDIKLKEGSMEQAGGTTTDGDAAGSLIHCVDG